MCEGSAAAAESEAGARAEAGEAQADQAVHPVYVVADQFVQHCRPNRPPPYEAAHDRRIRRVDSIASCSSCSCPRLTSLSSNSTRISCT